MQRGTLATIEDLYELPRLGNAFGATSNSGPASEMTLGAAVS